MMQQQPVTPTTRRLQRVAFVGKCSNDLLCDLMLGGDHDVVFVESLPDAYSCIKRVLPDIIVVSLSADDTDGCRVLSMLALDNETSRIPVLTYLTSANTGASIEDDSAFGRRDGFVLN